MIYYNEKVPSGAYKIDLPKKRCEKKAGRYPIQILRFSHKISDVLRAREMRMQYIYIGVNAVYILETGFLLRGVTVHLDLS